MYSFAMYDRPWWLEMFPLGDLSLSATKSAAAFRELQEGKKIPFRPLSTTGRRQLSTVADCRSARTYSTVDWSSCSLQVTLCLCLLEPPRSSFCPRRGAANGSIPSPTPLNGKHRCLVAGLARSSRNPPSSSLPSLDRTSNFLCDFVCLILRPLLNPVGSFKYKRRTAASQCLALEYISVQPSLSTSLLFAHIGSA
jgi:hypothetical protein